MLYCNYECDLKVILKKRKKIGFYVFGKVGFCASSTFSQWVFVQLGYL